MAANSMCYYGRLCYHLPQENEIPQIGDCTLPQMGFGLSTHIEADRITKSKHTQRRERQRSQGRRDEQQQWQAQHHQLPMDRRTKRRQQSGREQMHTIVSQSTRNEFRFSKQGTQEQMHTRRKTRWAHVECFHLTSPPIELMIPAPVLGDALSLIHCPCLCRALSLSSCMVSDSVLGSTANVYADSTLGTMKYSLLYVLCQSSCTSSSVTVSERVNRRSAKRMPLHWHLSKEMTTTDL